MSELPPSDPGTPSGSNSGGYRIAGRRSEKNQRSRDAAIKSTKEAWGVSEYSDIFPAAIKPLNDLGDSAIYNLRQLSRKVPDLAEARVLMTAASLSSLRDPIPISFCITSLILARLREQEEMEEEKKMIKDRKMGFGVSRAPGSSKNITTPDSLGDQKRLPAAVASVPTRGSAGVRAAKRSISPMDNKDPIASRNAAPENGSGPGKKALPARPSLPGNHSQLSKMKVTTPTPHLRQPSKLPQKAVHTSLTGGKNDSKEVISGLHAPSAQDVAPFKVNKPVMGNDFGPRKRGGSILSEDEKTMENTRPKKRVSFALDHDTIPQNLLKAGGNGVGASKPGARIGKETLRTELGFKETSVPKKGDGLPAGESVSEAETDVEEATKSKSSAGNVAKMYTFGAGLQKKDAGDGGTKKQRGDATGAGGHVLWAGKSVQGPKLSKQVGRVVPLGPRDLHLLPSPFGESMGSSLQDVKKKGKISGAKVESPASPKNSPEREEDIHSATARRLSELHDSKRVKTTSRTFSTPGQARTKLSLDPGNTSSDLSTKTNQQSFNFNKGIMDYSVSGGSDKAEKRSSNATQEKEAQLTPKAKTSTSTTPSRASMSTTPTQPTTTSGTSSSTTPALPQLPEILTARVPGDRAIIEAIPGIIKAYIQTLQAALPDGVAPDGDLLSMIIVNKYGYFLEHVEALDHDLKSLYYQAVERNEELERDELQREADKARLAKERKARRDLHWGLGSHKDAHKDKDNKDNKDLYEGKDMHMHMHMHVDKGKDMREDKAKEVVHRKGKGRNL